MQEGNGVLSIIMMAEQYGLSTGVVYKPPEITHATPATAYSNSASRNWESDGQVPDKRCSDIGRFIAQSAFFYNTSHFNILYK